MFCKFLSTLFILTCSRFQKSTQVISDKWETLQLKPIAVAEWIVHLLAVQVVSRSNPSILTLLHACMECDQLPCWLSRGQQVSHQRWIWGIHCAPGDKARKWGIHPGFETQGRRHQKSTIGVSVGPQKFFKKKGTAQLTHADWNTPICSSSSPAVLSSWRTWLASWCCTQVRPPEPADWPWIRAYPRVECTALQNYMLDNATWCRPSMSSLRSDFVGAKAKTFFDLCRYSV